MVKFSFDLLEFDKTSGGPVTHGDCADPNKEMVRLVNFTGMVCWPKNLGILAGNALDDGDSGSCEILEQKDVMTGFQVHGGVGMKTGIGSMVKKYAAPSAKPKPIVVVKEEKSMKQEPDAAGAKKTTNIIKQPDPKTITSNTVKPPPGVKPATKKIAKPKAAAPKKITADELDKESSLLDLDSPTPPPKAKPKETAKKGKESSNESFDSSVDRHHEDLVTRGYIEKLADVDTEMPSEASLMSIVDDKEEKKVAEDDVFNAVIQVKEPKKARGHPAAAPTAAAATASNKNKKNNNNNKVNDAPRRAATRGAAARK
jgi:hypothetical protein